MVYLFFLSVFIALMSSSVRLISFNCEGVKLKIPFIKSLCESADIVLLMFLLYPFCDLVVMLHNIMSVDLRK